MPFARPFGPVRACAAGLAALPVVGLVLVGQVR